jgi:hypothetical protein
VTHQELFYFTGRCLSLDEHPEFRKEIIELIQTAGTTLDQLVQLCSDHLIIPAIYLKFESHQILGFLPEELTLTLKEIYDLNRERNLQILQQIDDITTALNQENIYPVYLKGTGNLLAGIYSDVGERMMADIDLLVPETDYLKAASAIEAIGYRHDSGNYFDVFRFKHYPALFKNDVQAAIEIHWQPVDQKHAGSFDGSLLLSQKKPVSGKPGLFVPSDAHKVIHNFLHSQLGHESHQYKDSDFRGLYDLYLLSKRTDVSILASQTGYTQMANSYFAFAQRVLGLPGRFCAIETRSAKWFCLKYELALSYPKTYRVYTVIKKLIFTIFVRYAGGFLQAIFQKEQRISVYKRLKDPAWYRVHLASLKNYFV